MNQAQLHELIGSRICHDLISPLGAISNGLELVSLSGQELSPELRIIAESVENANARIRFFRVAYGMAAPDQMVSAAEARSILDDINSGGRITTSWDIERDQPRTVTKLAFLLIQCFETALPRGGMIRVAEMAGEWSISCEAERLSIDPDLWQALSKPAVAGPDRADKVQFVLAPMVAQAMNRQLRLDCADHTARLRF
jgi:histidine phosphotransferase ChpT